MIEQKTILNRGEIDFENNVFGIRFAKIVVKDGVEIAREWHRVSLEPTADLDKAMTAVNAHLDSMGEATVEATEIDRVRPVLPIIFTDEVKLAYAQRTAANALT